MATGTLTPTAKFELEVKGRVANVTSQFGMTDPLLDSNNLDYIARASGLDALDRKRIRPLKARWEREAKATAITAMQEAALMGAESADGKLTKDDMKYLMSKYGDQMVTSSTKIASTRNVLSIGAGAGIGFLGGFLSHLDGKKEVGGGVGLGAVIGMGIGIIGGPIGMAIGGVVGGCVVGLAQGLAKPIAMGLAGAGLGAAGGGMLPRIADFMKKQTGFGLGLGVDDHSKSLEDALKKAALVGHELAVEDGIQVQRISGRSRNSPVPAPPAPAPAPSAPGSGAPEEITPEGVVAENLRKAMQAADLVKAELKDSVVAPRLEAILDGKETGKEFIKLSADEQNATIMGLKAAGTAEAKTMADILTDIKLGNATHASQLACSLRDLSDTSSTPTPPPSPNLKVAEQSLT